MILDALMYIPYTFKTIISIIQLFNAIYFFSSQDLDDYAYYKVVYSITDEKTGFIIELGFINTMSSLCYTISVFKEKKSTRLASEIDDPVLVECHAGSLTPKITLEDGCYTINMYGYSELQKTVWCDPETGRSICFVIYPPGPTGDRECPR